MVLDRLFRPKAAQEAGRALYAAAVDQARRPALYADFAVADTVEGRFELYTLHVVLLLDRLRGHGERAADVSQSLFDTYVSGLDHALREMGVGDLSVGKKMRRLGEAFYGRVRSYKTAFAELPAGETLRGLLLRTVYGEASDRPVAALAAYVTERRDVLAGQSLDPILAGRVDWGTP